MSSRLPSLQAGAWFTATLAVGVLLGGITCSSTTIPPGSNDTRIGLRGQCVYPRACYVVAKSGPLAGQCDDCRTNAESCRLIFVPGATGAPALGDMGGSFLPAQSDMGSADGGAATSGPMPTDATGVCSLYVPTRPDVEAICGTSQSVCIARGPRCTGGSCIPAGTRCGGSVAVLPQRKPGLADADLYCPFTDDICCPAVLNDGGVSDAGRADSGMSDAGRSDAATLSAW
ncbi:MAG: hypothetical protein JNJ46_02250 [Myxococcales bacterium]|nr:hypothetical protein [Myxococcales bacterium]